MDKASLAARAGAFFMLGFEGTSPEEIPASLVARCGGVILFKRNIKDARQLRTLTDTIRAVPNDDGVPPLIAIDQEGGTVSRLAGIATTTPSAMALGATADPEITRDIYRLIGEELSAVGVSVNFAPVADTNNNPDNPVIGTRSFGDNPGDVGTHVRAAIRGLRAAGVAATAKHFPGHGDTTVDSHFDLPRIDHSIDRVRSVELVPFQQAIAENVDLIMTSHVLFSAIEPSGMPATLSRALLTDLLRGELGFAGVVCTDCMEMQAIADRYSPQDAALRAITAGADLVLFSHTLARVEQAVSAVATGIQNGTIERTALQQSFDRLLELRKRLAAPSGAGSLDVVGSGTHEQAALDAARRAVTIVRDPQRLIPLALQNSDRILVVHFTGTRATPVENEHDGKTGSHHTTHLARVLAKGPAKVLEQIRTLDPQGHEYKQLLMGSGTATVIIAVTSRAKQHPMQARAIADLAIFGKPLIVVCGREPYDATAIPEECTVLASYGDDPNAMRAAGDVLMGAVPARGRLPVILESRPAAPYP